MCVEWEGAEREEVDGARGEERGERERERECVCVCVCTCECFGPRTPISPIGGVTLGVCYN